MRRTIFLYLLLIFPLGTVDLLAQAEPETLSKNFAFADGVYLSLSDFQHNSPSLVWEEIDAMVISNPQNFMAQVSYIKSGQGPEAPLLDLEHVWGICLGGIPYIQLEKGAVKKSLPVFAGMRLRGKICYFNYEDEELRALDMPVYNPANQQVFRRVTIERKQTVVHEKLLDFETGEVIDFTIDNFREWIKDDQRLVETLAAMKEEEIQEKLFKCLLIYVDRNEVMIKNDNENQLDPETSE